MNFEAVEKIAAAVLYEGYILYPYRPTAIKNRQRWNFGTLYPQVYAQAQHPEEPYRLVAECLATAEAPSHTRRETSLPADDPPAADPGPGVGRSRGTHFRAYRYFSRQVDCFPALLTLQMEADLQVDLTISAQSLEPMERASSVSRCRTAVICRSGPEANRDEALALLAGLCALAAGHRPGAVDLLIRPRRGVSRIRGGLFQPGSLSGIGRRGTGSKHHVLLSDYPLRLSEDRS